jgi:hypothetical protein
MLKLGANLSHCERLVIQGLEVCRPGFLDRSTTPRAFESIKAWIDPDVEGVFAEPAKGHPGLVCQQFLPVGKKGEDAVIIYLTLQPGLHSFDRQFVPASLGVRRILTVAPSDQPTRIDTANVVDVSERVRWALSFAIAFAVQHTGPSTNIYLSSSAPQALTALMGSLIRTMIIGRNVVYLDRAHPQSDPLVDLRTLVVVG